MNFRKKERRGLDQLRASSFICVIFSVMTEGDSPGRTDSEQKSPLPTRRRISYDEREETAIENEIWKTAGFQPSKSNYN